MDLVIKSLIYTAVTLGYVHLKKYIETNLLQDFIILFILISIVSMLIRKVYEVIERKRASIRKTA